MNKGIVDLGYRLREALDEPFHVVLGILIPLKEEKPKYLLSKLHTSAWCVRIAEEYL